MTIWALIGVLLLVAAFRASILMGLSALALVPMGFLVAATLTRVWCELVIVVFRIADHTAETAEQAAAIALNTTDTIRTPTKTHF